ncbi:hypothetical protein CLV67_117216 [Actinoplanes italicus]|uniref:Uncharacterized protein n=1 Tax=Actinoplanes italicus TaxID=113567 RepID=A0A2T0K2U2_9ACTN|nr:hypothetical protein CLV67_117216 [Actinoplanes italicus]
MAPGRLMAWRYRRGPRGRGGRLPPRPGAGRSTRAVFGAGLRDIAASGPVKDSPTTAGRSSGLGKGSPGMAGRSGGLGKGSPTTAGRSSGLGKGSPGMAGRSGGLGKGSPGMAGRSTAQGRVRRAWLGGQQPAEGFAGHGWAVNSPRKGSPGMAGRSGGLGQGYPHQPQPDPDRKRCPEGSRSRPSTPPAVPQPGNPCAITCLDHGSRACRRPDPRVSPESFRDQGLPGTASRT